VERHKMLLWSSRRAAYLTLFVVAFSLTELGRYVYRPFVYERGLSDFGLADKMGNHLGAVTLVFFILFVMHATRVESYIVLGVVTFGYVGYELAQRWLPGSTSDPKDIVASLIGGVIALVLLRLVDAAVQRRSAFN
jgi:hypothetical protein